MGEGWVRVFLPLSRFHVSGSSPDQSTRCSASARHDGCRAQAVVRREEPSARGLKFRRQVTIGPFIVDFLALRRGWSSSSMAVSIMKRPMRRGRLSSKTSDIESCVSGTRTWWRISRACSTSFSVRCGIEPEAKRRPSPNPLPRTRESSKKVGEGPFPPTSSLSRFRFCGMARRWRTCPFFRANGWRCSAS